jgi:hypothetical protein
MRTDNPGEANRRIHVIFIVTAPKDVEDGDHELNGNLNHRKTFKETERF